MAKVKTPESYVLDACCDYLALKRYVFWRQNTMGVWDNQKQIFRKSKNAIKGVSDIILLKAGRVYFLECKSDVGKLSPDQVAFAQLVTGEGAMFDVIRSIDDLKKLGL